MSTLLQKNLAQNIVENASRKNPLNKKELVVLSGYDETTAEKQVPAVFEQKGVKEALADLGFTEENAKKVVSEIMLDSKKDPNARLKATDQVFKVHGSYNEKLGNTTNNIIFMPPELLQKYGLKNNNTDSSTI